MKMEGFLNQDRDIGFLSKKCDKDITLLYEMKNH